MEMTALPYSISTKPTSFFFNHGVFSTNPKKNDIGFTPSNKTNFHSSSCSTRGARKLNFASLSSNLDFIAPSRNDTSFGPPSIAFTPSSLPRLEDLDATNMLLRQRIVFLGSPIDDVTADFVINQILLLDAEDSQRDIKLFINSPGGSTTSGMGIYDAMKMCKADISTVCLGIAASMGAFLLAAGTKGKRFCMPNARVMLHGPLIYSSEDVEESILQIKEMMYHNIKHKKMLSRLTGKSEEQIESDLKHEFFMDAWDAKEYGLVDGVIGDGKPGLVAIRTDTSAPTFPNERIYHKGDKLDWETIPLLPCEEKLLQDENLGGDDNGDGGNEKEKETSSSV